MSQEIPTPQHKERRFDSEQHFNKWLQVTATKKLHLKDNSQDLLILYIDDKGEVLHCNAQASIWIGNMLDINYLEEAEFICWYSHNIHRWISTDFIIQKIETGECKYCAGIGTINRPEYYKDTDCNPCEGTGNMMVI